MSYCAYDHDYLEPADRMRIERCIYFESDCYSISELVVLPLANLIAMRRKSAEAEQEIYDRLKEQASEFDAGELMGHGLPSVRKKNALRLLACRTPTARNTIR